MKRHWFLFFFFPLVMCSVLLVHAQEQSDIDFSKLVHIGTEQGLSSNKVNCIIQDKKGFIWIGTDYGLNRYDGYSFKLFVRDENDSTSLTDNNITRLAQDAIGNIWIATPKGLNVMNYKTEKIQQYNSTNEKDALWKYNITALAADDSSVWIGTENKGLLQHNFFNGVLKKYLKPENEDSLTSGSVINNILIEANGNILLRLGLQHNPLLDEHARGLIELQKKTGKFKSIFSPRILLNRTEIKKYVEDIWINQPRIQKCIRYDWIETLYEDATGNLYLGTYPFYSGIHAGRLGGKFNTYADSDGKFFFRKNKDTVFKEIKISFSLKEYNIFKDNPSFIEYEPNKILSFTQTHSTIFNSEDMGRNVHYTLIPYPQSITFQEVFKDRSGKLWFITSTGIETLETNNFQYKIVSTKDKRLNSVIEDDEGKIWFGTDQGGLLFFDNDNKKINFFTPSKSKSELASWDWPSYETFVIGSSLNRKIYGINSIAYPFSKFKNTYYHIYAFDKFKKSFKTIFNSKKKFNSFSQY